MQYQSRWLARRQYPMEWQRFAPLLEDPLRVALHGRSCIHGKQRNVVILNWHNTQSWHNPGAVAALSAAPISPVSCATYHRGRDWSADIRAHIGCVTRF